jgi:hypothetical protein
MQTSVIKNFTAVVPIICCLYFTSCKSSQVTTLGINATQLTSAFFTIDVQPHNLTGPLPGLQACAWAINGKYLLLIGGRNEGYHGLPQNDTVFKTSKANQSIWVVDLSNFSYASIPINTNDSSLYQLFASDFEFCQDADTLYIIGGYGIQNATDIQSNITFARMTVIQVSQMIKQVQLQSEGNIKQAIINTIYSPFLQVTGGALVKQNDIFYLMFGQDYNGVYQPGKTGAYTNAVRQFQLINTQLVNTNSYTDTILHRRDLTVAPVVQNNKIFYAAFGGVFTADDNGYMNPVYIQPNGTSVSVLQDTLMQKTNQYNCANAVIFDPKKNICTNVLFGGIGRYQYDTARKKWLDGDQGAKLPFVQSITQMIYVNGVMHQHIQIPPQEPQMPGFIGADAIFIPAPGIANSMGIINYYALKSKRNFIGYILGGIKSVKPTSSNIYPTSTNNMLYAVYLNKNAE